MVNAPLVSSCTVAPAEVEVLPGLMLPVPKALASPMRAMPGLICPLWPAVMSLLSPVNTRLLPPCRADPREHIQRLDDRRELNYWLAS